MSSETFRTFHQQILPQLGADWLPAQLKWNGSECHLVSIKRVDFTVEIELLDMVQALAKNAGILGHAVDVGVRLHRWAERHGEMVRTCDAPV